ncbi:TAXI family TRAP transporter solute-binding subunit [Thermanaerosceptrum fracticalcis]|uniref:TAXI family TRAP transporter solute-binding subunit n=1 Tax=Thermanaerosceptrum fracticalcis TaxID=1712410 RepID=UPI00055982EB|nr:TAXI family TRAP transporter solute-binding subunit [Thermanaerosceptrum fracticalcis]
MKSKKVKLVAIFLSLVILLTIGCSTQEAKNKEENSKKDWPKGVTIGSSSMGGIYYVWAGAWSKIMMEQLKIPFSVEVSAGGVDNAKLVNDGKVDFGLAADGIVYAGLNGTEWAKGTKYENIRAIFPMYPGYFQWHTLSKIPIKSIHDMNGKRVVPGPAGSSADSYWRMIFEFFNIKPQISNAGYADATSLMQDGMIDAIGLAPTGVPHPSTAELATTHDVRIIGVSKDDIQKLQKQYPYMSVGQIPAGTYKGMNEPVDTIVIWNVMMANKNVSEDLVYHVVKATFENHEKLVAAHPSAKDTLAENIKYIKVPLHLGAIKYYKERGITIPNEAYPPEYKK